MVSVTAVVDLGVDGVVVIDLGVNDSEDEGVLGVSVGVAVSGDDSPPPIFVLLPPLLLVLIESLDARRFFLESREERLR